MRAAIENTYRNKQTYNAAATNDNINLRKQIQCPFRLLNILFSDEFAERFQCLGNVATREMLDTGKAKHDEHFWSQVRIAFVSNNDSYDNLLFKTDKHFFDRDDIDCSKIVPHGWKKLRDIWKFINGEYKLALVRFTASGTHLDNFFSFCNGRLDVYYLRLHLEI